MSFRYFPLLGDTRAQYTGSEGDSRKEWLDFGDLDLNIQGHQCHINMKKTCLHSILWTDGQILTKQA